MSALGGLGMLTSVLQVCHQKTNAQAVVQMLTRVTHHTLETMSHVSKTLAKNRNQMAAYQMMVVRPGIWAMMNVLKRMFVEKTTRACKVTMLNEIGV